MRQAIARDAQSPCLGPAGPPRRPARRSPLPPAPRYRRRCPHSAVPPLSLDPLDAPAAAGPGSVSGSADSLSPFAVTGLADPASPFTTADLADSLSPFTAARLLPRRRRSVSWLAFAAAAAISALCVRRRQRRRYQMPTPMAASSKIRPMSDHGTANSDALPAAIGAIVTSGIVCAGQPGVAVTCAVIGPAG